MALRSCNQPSFLHVNLEVVMGLVSGLLSASKGALGERIEFEI